MLKTKSLKEIIQIPKELKTTGGRPDWDNFFMAAAYFISTRSSCSDRMTGAVIVKDKAIIATGFNGAPRGIKDCLQQGNCIRQNRDKSLGKDYHNCYAAHAEVNALANNAFMGGVSTKGAFLYTTVYPCTDCARQIINAGIVKIFYAEKLPNDNGLADKFFTEAKIDCQKVDKEKVAEVMYRAIEHLILRDEEGKIV
ncbi:MAG: cytidine/deoxycytidylate deaminase family protein [Patescibacteria group bacterium]|nr:cytidine/deoxycytidylate deaminase family protein [Patescibacteria group bacterium]